MNEDRCVICGEIIPEGRQVCPTCERGGICEANGVVIEALEKQIPKKKSMLVIKQKQTSRFVLIARVVEKA